MREINSEKQLVRQMKKGSRALLYGAGMVGELTCRRLLSHGLKERILGFAVTQKTEGSGLPERFCGLPVYGIEELGYQEETLVLVTTLPNLHDEIKKNLSRLRYRNVVCISPRLYQDFFRNYASDFNKRHPLKPVKDANLRILFMASDNDPTSGAFLCLVELCSLLQDNGAAVTAVLPTYGQGATLLEQKDIPYIYVPAQDWGYEMVKEHDFFEKIKFFTGLLRNGRAKKELESLMKEHAIELVHCNTTYTYIGALAARDLGIPFVWHLREYMENQGYRIFMPVWGWNLIGQADKVIAVSEYIKSLIPLEGKASARVVYDTVEMPKQDCVEREILRQDTVRMIMVGGITQYKRQRELIDACAVLKNRNLFKNFYLTIVGRGDVEYLAKLRQAVSKYGLDEWIRFHGMSHNVSALYAEADIAFMCSIAEPYGRVTIEAQMSGCLVIGSDAGATPELVRDGVTGYLYEAGSSESLAEKIAAAVGSPEEARRIAKAGQQYALTRYTKERNLREIMDVYEEVLRRKIV